MQTLAAAIGLLFALGLFAAVAALALSFVYTGALAAIARWVPVIYNVRSLTRRRVTTGFTLLGLALVVFVVATVLMLRNGIVETLVTGGQPDNVVVLRSGANADIVSVVSREQAKLLGALDGVATDPKDGKPLLDPQVAVLISAQRASNAEDFANVTVRGLSERTLALHPNLKIAEGRMFKAGTSEIVIGRALVGRFTGAQLGAQWYFARRNWEVVGVVDAANSSFGSEVWGDVDQVMDAFHRSMYSTVVMKVRDAGAIPALAAQIASDPKLNLDARQERKYFADLSSNLSSLLTFLGLFVAIVFTLAATLGAAISMYAQVAARTREVGTLRAIGFRREAILVSFVFESTLLGLLAGVVGIAGASLMELASFTTINFGTFSEVTFHFKLSGGVIVVAEVFAAVMGYAGGLLPAIRASRMPIVVASRA
jgi:putative ABC transport system permease protein